VRVLFGSHPTVGHTAPLRTIARELHERGHRAAFVLPRMRLPFMRVLATPIRAAAELPAMIERDGFELLEARPSPATLWHASRLPSKTGYEELRTAVDLFTSGAASHARTIAAHITGWILVYLQIRRATSSVHGSSLCSRAAATGSRASARDTSTVPLLFARGSYR